MYLPYIACILSLTDTYGNVDGLGFFTLPTKHRFDTLATVFQERYTCALNQIGKNSSFFLKFLWSNFWEFFFILGICQLVFTFFIITNSKVTMFFVTKVSFEYLNFKISIFFMFNLFKRTHTSTLVGNNFHWHVKTQNC